MNLLMGVATALARREGTTGHGVGHYAHIVEFLPGLRRSKLEDPRVFDLLVESQPHGLALDDHAEPGVPHELLDLECDSRVHRETAQLGSGGAAEEELAIGDEVIDGQDVDTGGL